jgi:hypothetical protein
MIAITASVAAALGVVTVACIAWSARPKRFAQPCGARDHNGAANDPGAHRMAAGQPTHRVIPRPMVPGTTRRLRSGLQMSLQVVTSAPGCHRRAGNSRDGGLYSRAAGPSAPGAGARQRLC